MNNLKQQIFFIIPSLSTGGAERVMAHLVNYFSENKNIEAHLLLFYENKIFYKLSDNIKLHVINHDSYFSKFKLLRVIKAFFFIRNKLKKERPIALLSFGGNYNSFVMTASMGLKIRCFISNRSQPGLSYGKIADWLNKKIYPTAYGIIAQTQKAKDYLLTYIQHKNIRIISNPFQVVSDSNIERKNIILNVGRFAATKHQDILIKMFNEINPPNWELHFVGDGEKLNYCKGIATGLETSSKIIFHNAKKDVNNYYLSSKIFAFISSSEGFPNALGEAMAAGCACISYDCDAGPSDLITNYDDGILIPLNNYEEYKESLINLMQDENLQTKLSTNAQIKMNKFSFRKIAMQYSDFILNS